MLRFQHVCIPQMDDHTHTNLNANVYTQHCICSVRDSWSLLPGSFREGQSVSVISACVSSQSWEWHETHKASLCQSCGLLQSVPPHCHRKKVHISHGSSFKKREGDMLKAQTA